MIMQYFHNDRLGHLDLRFVVSLLSRVKNSCYVLSERQLYQALARSSSTMRNSPLAPSTYCFIYGKRSFKRRLSPRLETQRALRAQGILWPTPSGISWTSEGVCTTACSQNLTNSPQPSFYPLFPTPKAFSADVNLDVSHSELLKLEEAPDVLILPSTLGKFHKVSTGLSVRRTWIGY
jgi:hypothetical protein